MKASPTPSLNEAERDRIPHYRSPRDLSTVPTDDLQSIEDKLGAAVMTIRQIGGDAQPLLDGILDIERELVRREIVRGRQMNGGPSPDVVRISHISTGRSGWAFSGGAS